MSSFTSVAKFVDAAGDFTLPQLQSEFGLSYGEVRKFVRELLREGSAEYLGGMRYRCFKKPECLEDPFPDEIDPDLFDDPDELDELLSDEDDEDEEDEEDDGDGVPEWRDFREFFERNNKRYEEIKREKAAGALRLAEVLKRVAEVRGGEVPTDRPPFHSLWTDESEFTEAVEERLKRLIASDPKMARRGAIVKAEAQLEGVRDTHDGKMLQVYERIVYELKTASDYLYNSWRIQYGI